MIKLSKIEIAILIFLSILIVVGISIGIFFAIIQQNYEDREIYEKAEKARENYYNEMKEYENYESKATNSYITQIEKYYKENNIDAIVSEQDTRISIYVYDNGNDNVGTIVGNTFKKLGNGGYNLAIINIVVGDIVTFSMYDISNINNIKILEQKIL